MLIAESTTARITARDRTSVRDELPLVTVFVDTTVVVVGLLALNGEITCT